jgi:hypothetical protein
MATSPATPQQAGGSGQPPQQQQGAPVPQQAGQPIFRDWASI